MAPASLTEKAACLEPGSDLKIISHQRVYSMLDKALKMLD